jgi:mannose-6-phosphate isomerase-like protein (cupin superfamily)
MTGVSLEDCMPYVRESEALNEVSVNVPDVQARLGAPPWRAPLIASEHVRAVLLSVDAGCSPHPTHYHPRVDEIFIVLDGTGFFMVGDAPEFAAPAGSLVYGPRGVLHSMRASESGPLTWISVVTPNEEASDTEIAV